MTAPYRPHGVDPLARAFFWVALTFGAAALALIGLLVAIKPAASMSVLSAMAFGFIGALGLGARLAQRGRLRAGVVVVLMAGYLSATVFGLFAAAGILTSAFGLYGLIALAAGVLLGARAAWVAGALCAATLVGLHVAEDIGWLADPAAGLRPAPSLRLGVQLILLGASVLLASLFSRAMQASLAAASEQEQRFRRLVAIGTDWYWEQDREYRFTRIVSPVTGVARPGSEGFIGRLRWELPDSGLTPAQWEAHRADLDARRPFRDLVMSRRNAEGRRRYISISGEPIFDRRGRFTGYWGVGRDVTADIEERHARMDSEARFRSLLGIAADWYWEQDTELRFTRLEGTAERAIGVGASHVLGRRRWEIEGFEVDPQVWEAHRADLDARRPFRNLVLKWRRPDGANRFFCISGEPNVGADGEYRGYWGVARDVTDEVASKVAVEASERRYRVLFDRSPMPKVIHRNGVALMANESAARLFGGAGPAELAGKNLLSFCSADEHGRVQARIAELESLPEGGELPAAELRFVRADGSVRVVQATSARVMHHNGLATLSVYVDITERKRAEEQVRASEAMLSRLFDACPDYLGVGEIASGRLHRVNDGFTEITGIAREEATGRTVFELGFWAEPAQRLEVVRQLAATGVARNVPATIRRRDGQLRQLLFSCATFEMDGTQFMVANGRDVTERERAQAALRRSEAMLARLFEASPDAIVVSEVRSSRLVMVNERFVSMFGYARDELIGRTSLELGIWLHPAHRERVIEAVERDGIVHAMPVTRRTKDGRILSVRYSAARLELDGEHFMVAAIRDVTEQEREHLQQQAILGNASVGIAFTRDRVFQLVNASFEQMFGWEPGTLAGQSGTVVWPSAEAYAEVGRTLGPRLAAGELVAEDFRMYRRGGGVFWCRIRARAIDPGNPVSGGTVWIAEDVTDARAAAAELAAAKEAAEAANRAKSVFLANTSHEIRTPLNGLLGLTRLALRPNVDARTQRRYLEQIQESGASLHAIISDILDLSKIEAGKLTIEHVDFDLRGLLNSVAASYRELTQQKGLGFELRIDENLPRRVVGDPTRIRQMLSNYLSNALKFTPRGRIELRAASSNDRLRLSVSDSGIGIDAAVRAKLFTPFAQGDASTTRRYGGTGLGLSICRELAELMAGSVGVDSRPGAGSTFWVELPMHVSGPHATPSEATPAGAIDAGALHGTRVLLAEDNDVNRLIAETLLAEWGVRVVTAADGRAAVAAVDAALAEGAGFDLVLMDLHMPVMNGIDAAAALRGRHDADALPILALTAAALGPEREQCLATGMNDLIAKPFEEKQLFEAVLRWTTASRAARAAAVQ